MATPGSQSPESGSSARVRAHRFAGDVVDKVQETASRLAGTGQETGGSQGGQSGGHPDSITDQAAEQVTSRLDMGKDYLVETISGVAHALRATGQQLRDDGSAAMLAQYADRGAEQIERIGGHMRQRDASELLSEVEGFARRQPMVFATGAFALGMLAVRFLRSSGQQAQQPSYGTGATSSGGAYGSGSPMSPGTSGTPQSYAGSATASPSTVPSGTGNTPTMNPGTPAAPGSSSPSTPGLPTSRPSGTPSSSSGTTTSSGTAAPGSSSGTQSGRGSSGSERMGTGSRSQP